jgi:alpha-mannosidase
MRFYGVGNHGGPTKQNIECIHRLDGAPESSQVGLEHAKPLKKANDKGWSLPVVHDALQHHARGCYSAHSGIKQWNRRAENALLRAEKLATVAHWVVGQPYPADLSKAWKDVLFNQFHDILAGTCLEVAYQDAQHLYGEAMAIVGAPTLSSSGVERAD